MRFIPASLHALMGWPPPVIGSAARRLSGMPVRQHAHMGAFLIINRKGIKSIDSFKSIPKPTAGQSAWQP
jgi:hypothetical protein